MIQAHEECDAAQQEEHKKWIEAIKVVPCHYRYPPVHDSIQIGRRQDIGQWVIVGSNEKGLVLQILPKLFGHGPFQGQELQFRRVVLQLASLEAATGGFCSSSTVFLLVMTPEGGLIIDMSDSVEALLHLYRLHFQDVEWSDFNEPASSSSP